MPESNICNPRSEQIVGSGNDSTRIRTKDVAALLPVCLATLNYLHISDLTKTLRVSDFQKFLEKRIILFLMLNKYIVARDFDVI